MKIWVGYIIIEGDCCGDIEEVQEYFSTKKAAKKWLEQVIKLDERNDIKEVELDTYDENNKVIRVYSASYKRFTNAASRQTKGQLYKSSWWEWESVYLTRKTWDTINTNCLQIDATCFGRTEKEAKDKVVEYIKKYPYEEFAEGEI